MQAQADRTWQYKTTLLFCGATALWVNKDIAPPEKSSSARPGDTVCILHALNRLKFFNTSSRPANFNFAANPQRDNDLLLDCKGFISKENQTCIFRQREKPVPFTVQLVALYIHPHALETFLWRTCFVIEASCKHRDEQQEETKNLQAANCPGGLWDLGVEHQYSNRTPPLALACPEEMLELPVATHFCLPAAPPSTSSSRQHHPDFCSSLWPLSSS